MATNGATPKITFYTNDRCPWAHRSAIVIKELGLDYEKVIIDLNTPREPWYLEVNPRGLVPSIKYNGDIVTESAIVSQFLADAHPSHLVPSSDTVEGALKRARINFFVDTYFSKLGSFWLQIAKKEDAKEKEELAKEFVSVVGKEIEPLLKDASPFFGGSDKLTLAEALTAPFIIRIYAFLKNGLLPESIQSGFNALPNFSRWAAEVVKHPSVTYVFDEASIVEGTKKRLGLK